MEKEKEILGTEYQESETDEFEPYNYFNCMRLLHECVKNNILRTNPNNGDHILIYREKGKTLPEGWYSENIFDVARELMDDIEGQKLLTKELLKAGITFQKESFM